MSVAQPDKPADTRFPMLRIGASEFWTGFVPGMSAGDGYLFAVTGADGRTQPRADPMARWALLRPATASRVAGPSAHAWADGEWMRARAARDPHRSPMRVYEVHLGSWRRRPDGSWLSYAEIGPLLAEHCRRLGFTHVELLPIAEHPFDGSWGYQVTGFYAPTARFGAPDDLRSMVDLLHRAGIGVILDWVPAHFPKDAHALARFDGGALYEHADPMRGEHPDWGTLVFDYGRPPVRNFLVANALYWLDEFHFDGLRVDAVASMLYLDYSRRPGKWRPNVHGGKENLEALGFLRELNDRVHRAVPGAVTMAEESTAFPGVTRPTDQGGLGFDLKWDMGWMHDTLDYFRRPPTARAKHRQRVTFRGLYLGTERWLLPLSHDEVVHIKGSLLGKMPGDDAQRFASLRSLLANQLGQPGKKLLFMGSELGSAAEWDHDGELPWAAAVGDARRLGLARCVADMGTLYRAHPALWEGDEDPSGFSWIDIGEEDGTTFAWLRRGLTADGAADHVVIVQNLGPSKRRGYRLGLPFAGTWRIALDTDARRYGGSTADRRRRMVAVAAGVGEMPASATITLPALGTVFLRPATD
jgi:1,4-alpha-glucan branching enzyme